MSNANTVKRMLGMSNQLSQTMILESFFSFLKRQNLNQVLAQGNLRPTIQKLQNKDVIYKRNIPKETP